MMIYFLSVWFVHIHQLRTYGSVGEIENMFQGVRSSRFKPNVIAEVVSCTDDNSDYASTKTEYMIYTLDSIYH